MKTDKDKSGGGRRARGWAKSTVAWTLRVLGLLLLLVVAVVAYLHVVGVPRAVLDDALDRLAEEGWHVKADRLRLTIDRGVVATGVEVYGAADSVTPFAKAKSISAALSPVLLLRHATVAPTLELEGGTLEATFGGRGGTAPRRVKADRIRVRFSARSGELVFREAEATCLGIRMRGHGAIYTGGGGGEMPENPLGAVLDALAEMPEEVLEAIDALNTVRFGEGTEARFSFTVYPDHPEATAGAVRLEAPNGVDGLGVRVDAFQAEAAWKEGVLEPVRVSVESGGGRLGVEAAWNTVEDVAWARAENTIPVSALAPALPDEARRALEETLEPLDFPWRVTAKAEPGPAGTLADRAEGRVEAWGGMRVAGMQVASVSASMRRDGNEWRVPAAALTMEKAGERCTLEVSNAVWEASAGTFRGRLRGAVRPDVLLDCTAFDSDSFVRDILERFAFTRAGEVDFRVAGRTDPFDFTARGRAAVKGASLHGVAVDSAETMLTVTPSNLVAAAAKMSRGDDLARGDVKVDFDRSTVWLDVDTTFAPRDICRLLGPTVEEFAAPFRMEGPCHSSLKGTLDYHNFSRTLLTGHAEGERLGFGPVETETAVADVGVRGYRVDVSNVVARLWGGDVTGEASFFPVRTADTWHFEGAADARKVSLADALNAVLGGERETELRGAVSCAGTLSGDFGEGFLGSLGGDMRVSVADGLLFQTKLLSGLSSILQYVIPGFDWFAQTDAAATVSIRRGIVRTEDATIAGPLFGVSGKGSCGTDGSKLNFQVEVKLLDRGIVATVVHIATAPLTRLLKFRLKGSLANPDWEAVNLNPKKLLKIVKPSTYTGGNGEDSGRRTGPAKPLPVPTAVP